MTKEHLSDLLEATRVVVRLLHDGERLDDIMTDEWIKESLGTLVRCRGYHDEDWGATRDATNRAHKEATEILETALRQRKVPIFGVCCGKEAEGQRQITENELKWRRIDFKDNLLATPFGKKPQRFPPFLDVGVDMEVLQQECKKVIEAMAKTKEVKAGEDGSGPSPRTKGRKPTLLNRVLAEMNDDLNNGYDLGGAIEEELASKYRASRDTCRKARNKIQSGIVEN